LASKKDELLQGLDSSALLKLARSVSESPVESGTTRAELVKIIKGSLSVEEITMKLKQEEGASKVYGLTGTELRMGSVGQVFLTVYGLISTFNNPAFTSLIGAYGYYQTSAIWGLIGSISFLLFAVLLTVSILKIPREIGGRAGRVTCLLGTVAAIVGIILNLLGLAGTAESIYQGLVSLILSILDSWLVGATLTLFGVFFLACQKHFSNGDLWTASGVLYIVSGGSLFGIVGLLVGPSASFVAAIFGAVCFRSAKPME
jgi:uncharacterized membrane protein